MVADRTLRAAAAPLAIALLTTAVFWTCLNAGFVSIDDSDFTRPPFMGIGLQALRWMFTQPHACNYAPLSFLSWGLDFAVWGYEPMGYHLTNVLFHAANAALFYLVCLELFARGRPGYADRAAAAAAALLFSLHPLRVQSVAWVSERRDVVCGFFFLLSLRLWLKSVRAAEPAATRGKAAAFAAFLGALMGKAAAVPLPAILVLLDVWPLRRMRSPLSWRESKALWLEKLPFFVLSLVFARIGSLAQAAGGAVVDLDRAGLGGRIQKVLISLVFYLGKTLWPAALTFYEWRWAPIRAAVLVGAAALAALLAAAWRWRRARPALLAAAAYQTFMLAPTLGIMVLGHEIVADRYSYLSQLSWAALAGVGFREFWRRRRAAAAAVAVSALAILSATTRAQIEVWRDTASLLRHALAVDPLQEMARPTLAGHLMEVGRVGEAVLYLEEHLRLYPKDADVRKALEQIVAENRITPRGHALIHEQLGQEFAAKGERAKAVWHLERALRYDPSPRLRAELDAARLAGDR
ncbi:MAG: hypothetical protein HYZ74_02780 [Elusimicrobia bacterium]|nr:hypothetical protein [Elusimicrobiota bacterium]